MSNDPKTSPSDETRAEEARDAQRHSGADTTDGPQSPVAGGVDEDVAEHYEEMADKGANQQGEGRLP
jgi:hypothetical protein